MLKSHTKSKENLDVKEIQINSEAMFRLLCNKNRADEQKQQEFDAIRETIIQIYEQISMLVIGITKT